MRLPKKIIGIRREIDSELNRLLKRSRTTSKKPSESPEMSDGEYSKVNQLWRRREFITRFEDTLEFNDTEYRTLINNRGGLDTQEILRHGRMRFYRPFGALYQLAYIGDALAEKMVHYFCGGNLESIFSSETQKRINTLLWDSRRRILEKLLTRKMKEKEYLGYLNGTRSIGKENGILIYLPK